MRITRLEIFGFKSFVDRFVLNFDSELIGVVGPNGCGKSNIVDALRWVLGETHAKQLRGNVLDDLIFNGSETRRPLGMAEVSITIRPEENWQPAALNNIQTIEQDNDNFEAEEKNNSKEDILTGLESIPGLFDASELQLTRRLYRSGESEYFINRVPCRLRDMIDLYRVIGLGARGLSIVQQGHIGSIVQKKPVERRELLEEAAGISGFRSRLEATERKLDRTSQNMARIVDIINEVQKQVRNLRRQAEKAERRNELKSELKDLEIELFISKVAGILSKRAEVEAQLSAEKEILEKKVSEISLAEADEERYRSEVLEIEVELTEQRQKRDGLITELNLARKSESETRVQLAKIEGGQQAVEIELTQIDRRKSEIGEEIAKRDLESEENQKKVEALNLEIQTLENKKRDAIASESENLVLDLEADLAQSKSLWSIIKDAVNDQNALLNYVTVPDYLEKAVSNVLGEKLVYSVNYDDGAFGKIEPQTSVAQSDSQREKLLAAGARPLTELIEIEGAVRQKVETLLSEIYYVADDSLAKELISQSESQSLCIIGSSGDAYHCWGVSFAKRTPVYFELDNKIAGITSRLNTIKSQEEAEKAQFEQELRDKLVELSQFKTKSSMNEAQVLSLRGELEKMELRRSELLNEQGRLKEMINSLGEQLSLKFDDPMSDERKRAHHIEDLLLGLEKEIQTIENKLSDRRSELAKVSHDFGSSRSLINSLNQKCSDLKLELEKADVELSMLLEDVSRAYPDKSSLPSESEISGLLERAENNLSAYTQGLLDKVGALRRKLEREGEVDPESIELYQQEKERLDSLQGQYNDLSQAKKTLEQTAEHLKEVSKERFLETFSFVSNKFEELLPRLFGGGAGHMELIDPEDPLSSGVELSIRPPGKKLRNIELLSGGEKALAATAIIMSMFLYRPSPICVLDEVDAPLDDANLERFLDMISEISSSTQFLIITHNKITMAAVKRLIGITMQEKGVSKALEVDFGQAEAEIAKAVVNA